MKKLGTVLVVAVLTMALIVASAVSVCPFHGNSAVIVKAPLVRAL